MTDVRAPHRARIPRDPEHDHTDEIAHERQAFVAERTGPGPEHVRKDFRCRKPSGWLLVDGHVVEGQEGLDPREDDEQQQRHDGEHEDERGQDPDRRRSGQVAPDPGVHERVLPPQRSDSAAGPLGISALLMGPPSRTAWTISRWRAEYRGWHVVSVR